MMAPFFQNEFFGFSFSLFIALIIGISFGFFLERGGLGNSKKLAAQFYLTDLTVFKVMFTAVITAMLGLFWLSWLGILDLSLVYINPTYILPQLIAGLVFGVGFVVAGLCPGTTCVAFATGKIDGLVCLLGIFIGIFIFGELFDYFYDFAYSTSMGQITLPQFFNIPFGLIILLVVILALAGFWGAEVVEKKTPFFPTYFSYQTIFKNLTNNKKLGLIALTFALLAAVAGSPDRTRSVPDELIAEIKLGQYGADYLDVQQLAGWIMEKKSDFDLYDLRSKRKFDDYHIPFAQNTLLNSIMNFWEERKRSFYMMKIDQSPQKYWKFLPFRMIRRSTFLKVEWMNGIQQSCSLF